LSFKTSTFSFFLRFKASILACAFGMLSPLASLAQANPVTPAVTIIGQMKEVMKKGQLQGKIQLDTLADKTHLYGLGPVAYLAGEIMVWDGRAYKSTVRSDGGILVEESFEVAAPFFGYSRIAEWQEVPLPDSVQSLAQLEQVLLHLPQRPSQPFMFKLEGRVQTATIHIVNLPKGSKVSSPEEAHRGQQNYPLQNEEADILGFFSTEHQAVFTHHDTFLHLHLLTKDRQKMGHVDAVSFSPGKVRLFLPLSL
jgi:acetolactate decarboxylase